MFKSSLVTVVTRLAELLALEARSRSDQEAVETSLLPEMAETLEISPS